MLVSINLATEVVKPWSVGQRHACSVLATTTRTSEKREIDSFRRRLHAATPPTFLCQSALSFVRCRPVSSSRWRRPASSTRELSLVVQRSNDGVESQPRARHPSPVTRPVDTARPDQSGRTRPDMERRNDESDVRTTLSHCSVLIAWPPQRLIDWQRSTCFWRLQLLLCSSPCCHPSVRPSVSLTVCSAVFRTTSKPRIGVNSKFCKSLNLLRRVPVISYRPCLRSKGQDH